MSVRRVSSRGFCRRWGVPRPAHALWQRHSSSILHRSLNLETTRESIERGDGAWLPDLAQGWWLYRGMTDASLRAKTPHSKEWRERQWKRLVSWVFLKCDFKDIWCIHMRWKILIADERLIPCKTTLKQIAAGRKLRADAARSSSSS